MKLRIKETGEILEDVKFIDTTLSRITIQYLDNGVLRECTVKNLSDVEEVKDYEEPKASMYITGPVAKDDNMVVIEFYNHEEAEKATEILKAIKKLKDYDLHIEWSNTPEYDENDDIWWCGVDFSVREGCDGDKLFYLLFGGEE